MSNKQQEVSDENYHNRLRKQEILGEDSYEKRLTYYYIGHFSRYIKEGAVKIGTSRYIGGLEVTAFLNPDGERVVILFNKSEKEIPYTLREMAKDAGYQGTEGVLAPHSIQTVLY